MQDGRLTIEQQAARIAREASRLGMDAPTLQVLLAMNEQLSALRDEVAEVRHVVDGISVENEKEWYTTKEVAELMGVSRHHVTERWCNQARIECDKDPQSGQWRIPGYEYDRLRRGGKPRPVRMGSNQG